MKTLDIWQNSLQDAQKTLSAFLENPENLEKCTKFSEILTAAFRNQNKLMTCGNGGSHCDAMHCAEEFTGRYRDERQPLGAMALGDGPHTTCVANDYGFEEIFSRQVAGLGKKGDVLLALSTSGNSENVIRAVNKAKEMGIHTVALLGKTGGKLKDLADLSIVIPADTSDRIQEMHIKLIHTVIESVERELFPENYSS